MNVLARLRDLTPLQRSTFTACFLGWSLDAFDFFILIFCVSAISADFHTPASSVVKGVFLTLAMRPVGALLFGMMADRFGRRPTLMVDIIAYSIFELGSAFAPNLTVFLIMRALFGVAMGGEWGVGAALAFETLPVEGRGVFSGLLQEGYVIGNLMAALAYGTVFSHVGWRGMFVIGALPAFLTIYIRSKVEESPAWVKGQAAVKAEFNIMREVVTFLPRFLFLVVLMFAFNSFSHGTQDLYPTFLTKDHHFAPKVVSSITIVANIGALLGGIFFGSWSEKIGRRKAIVIAALLSIPCIPLWAHSKGVIALAAGGFLMQFMVQGAWGIIPAHLNELSPPSVRGTFPGLTYQGGNLLASGNQYIQARMVEKYYGDNYAPILSWTILVVALLVALVTWLGDEKKSADLSSTHIEAIPAGDKHQIA